jgi:post-segregation antitoxin (ccd killing protein)
MAARTYDTKAAVQTVKRFGINTSQIAEEALAAEVARRRAELVKVEIEKDLAACSEYSAKHGSFADMVRDRYRSDDE